MESFLITYSKADMGKFIFFWLREIEEEILLIFLGSNVVVPLIGRRCYTPSCSAITKNVRIVI
jgi:hypothetical protein